MILSLHPAVDEDVEMLSLCRTRVVLPHVLAPKETLELLEWHEIRLKYVTVPVLKDAVSYQDVALMQAFGMPL